jgi:Tellurite resistance protein TerB
MKIAELTPEEEVVLVALIREIVQADDVYSASESARVASIRDALGHDRFDDAVERAKSGIASRAELKELAKSAVRVEARRVVYDTLLGVALSDGLHMDEAKPLRWLASWWDLET